MQELQDTALLEEFGTGKARSASVGIILLVIVADTDVQTFTLVERAAYCIAVEKVTLFTRGADTGKIWMEARMFA